KFPPHALCLCRSPLHPGGTPVMNGKKGNDKIFRRDFINGMLIAAGTAAVGGSFPMRAYGASTNFPCDGPVGSDPNVLRGGNVPSVFNIAHWLRDGRLT